MKVLTCKHGALIPIVGKSRLALTQSATCIGKHGKRFVIVPNTGMVARNGFFIKMAIYGPSAMRCLQMKIKRILDLRIKKMTDVTNFDDIIDSHDVIARIEELKEALCLDEIEELVEQIKELRNSLSDADKDDQETIDNLCNSLALATTELDALRARQDDDDLQELKALEALADEASQSPDWDYGETLIRDSYFVEYAQELAEECDMIPDNLSWPLTCIDWEQAANELKYDYMAVDFDGVTYWIR